MNAVVKRGVRWAMLAVALSAATPAAAQTTLAPGPPGPYVVDLRGATVPIPRSDAFYPLSDAPTLVPERAFGFEAAGHVYAGRLGAARLGAGAAFTQVRGTTGTVEGSVRIVAPQMSLNFGTGDGWSYVGGGVGIAAVRTRVGADPLSGDAATEERTRVAAINVGAGARWFLTPRFGIGFDLRVYRLLSGRAGRTGRETPATTLLAAAIGLSVR